MKLIGKGETAEVYLLNKRVLKIFKEDIPKTYALREYEAVKRIGDLLDDAPIVFEFYEKDRLGYYMEFVEGKSIESVMTEDNYRNYAVLLGQHHKELHEKEYNFDLISLKSNLKRFINSLQIYDQSVLRWLLDILDTLDDGISILHGDFMPYNIHEGFKVLDWSDVMKGPGHADVARTVYFLLDPELNHYPFKNIVKHYLEGYYRDRIPYEILHKWLIINAALGYVMAVEEKAMNDYFERMHQFVLNNYRSMYSDKLLVWE